LKIVAELDLPSVNELIKECNLDKGGEVQMYIDNFILEQSEPYLPGKHLHDSGHRSTIIGTGEVVWDSDDALYLHEGKLMVDPITLKGAFFNPNYGYWSRPNEKKILDPEGRDLDYHGGGLRGKDWVNRMLEDKEDELIKGCQNIVNRGAKWKKKNLS